MMQVGSEIQIRRGLSDNNAQSISSGSEILTSSSTNEPHYMFSFLNTGVQRKQLAYLPRKILRWIYSFSLILLIVFSLAFIAITPIDVIVQTTSQSSSAIKMFIVIIGHVLFLVLSLLIYLSRVYQSRVALNDIPTKSVYIPQRNDLPGCAYNAIERKYEECMEIKVKAGPLYYSDTIINHPGASPPEYIQKRYGKDDGMIFPPEECYEDVIRSIGDKLSMGPQFLSQVQVPPNYSLREIVIYLFNFHVHKGLDSLKDGIPNISRMNELYEKFKFGPDLIKEDELIEFISDFSKLGQIFSAKFDTNFDTSSTNESKPFSKPSNFNEGFLTVPKMNIRNRGSLHDEFENVLQRNLNGSYNTDNLFTENSVGTWSSSSSSSTSSDHREERNRTSSLTGSIIKRKLSLAATYSDDGSFRGRSGYFSDEEAESVNNNFNHLDYNIQPVDTNDSYSSLKYSKRSS